MKPNLIQGGFITYIVGIEKIKDDDLKSIIKEASEELDRREKDKIAFADNIARVIYNAIEEGFSVAVHTVDGTYVLPSDPCEFVISLARKEV